MNRILLIIFILSSLNLSAQTQPRLVLPVGHELGRRISNIQISENKELIITNAYKDFNTCIWDFKTGKLVHKIPGVFSWLIDEILFVYEINDENKLVFYSYLLDNLSLINSFSIDTEIQNNSYPGILVIPEKNQLYTLFNNQIIQYNINSGKKEFVLPITNSLDEASVLQQQTGFENKFSFNPYPNEAFNGNKSKFIFWDNKEFDNTIKVNAYIFDINSRLFNNITIDFDFEKENTDNQIIDIQFGLKDTIFCFKRNSISKYSPNGKFINKYDFPEENNSVIEKVFVNIETNEILLNFHKITNGIPFYHFFDGKKMNPIFDNPPTGNYGKLSPLEWNNSSFLKFSPSKNDNQALNFYENTLDSIEFVNFLDVLDDSLDLEIIYFEKGKEKSKIKHSLFFTQGEFENWDLFTYFKKLKDGSFFYPNYFLNKQKEGTYEYNLIVFDDSLREVNKTNLFKTNINSSLRDYNFENAIRSKGIELTPILPIQDTSINISFENFRRINGRIYYQKNDSSIIEPFSYKDRYLDIKTGEIQLDNGLENFPIPILKNLKNDFNNQEQYNNDYPDEEDRNFRLDIFDKSFIKSFYFTDSNFTEYNRVPIIFKTDKGFLVSILNWIIILDSNLDSISSFRNPKEFVLKNSFSKNGDYLVQTYFNQKSEFLIEQIDLRTKKSSWIIRYDNTTNPVVKIVMTETSAICYYNSGLIESYDLESGKSSNKITVKRNRGISHVKNPFYLVENYLITEGKGEFIQVLNSKSLNLYYSIIDLGNDRFLFLDKYGRFDCSEEVMSLLYLVCGSEIIDLAQVKDSLWIPNLVQRIMNGENLDHLPKLSELNICDVTPVIEPLENDKSGKQGYRIIPRSGGVGDVDVYINGVVRLSTNAKKLKREEGNYMLYVEKELLELYLIPGEELKVKVIAKTANNSISSRGVVTEIETEVKTTFKKPSLHAIMIGVDDYKGEGLDLNYAAKDANDLQTVLQKSAQKFFNIDDTSRVHFYNLTVNRSGANGNEKIKGITPDRTNIINTIAEIEKTSKPEDILVLFFAGHGEIVDKDQLLLLTSESSREDFKGLRMRELLELLNKVPAGKRVLILDACHSGAAINNLDMAQLTGKRDVKDAERQSQRLKELDKLASKSGFAIITASSSDQKALELPQYEHGLMTYALLNAMLNNKISLDENNQLQLDKWLMATEEEVSKLNANQSAERMVPINFTLGKVDDEVRSSIVLKEIPLVYIKNVINTDLAYDNLEIETKLNEYFSNRARGGDKSLLLASVDQSNATLVNILYTKEKNIMNLKITILKNNQVHKQFTKTGTEAQLNDLIKEIALEIEAVVK